MGSTRFHAGLGLKVWGFRAGVLTQRLSYLKAAFAPTES